ncbi:trypsin-like serine protease [Marinicella sediminis]|uniref:trypsin-like serine protease n=1 Tax=Marinicella sediminis TaxID=1792834 RepID=UPI0018E369C3|nr:trypsin-like serine protease [Marinicella sediminis]
MTEVAAVIPDHEKQWLGSIHWLNDPKCTVSLIHPSFVLTADHCNAATGSSIHYKHLEEPMTVEQVCKICRDQSCDIMILKLNQPVTTVDPIDIAAWSDFEFLPNGKLYSTGSPDYSRTMMMIENSEPSSDMTCGDGYQDANQLINTNQGCMCPKDSGGAVTVTENDKEVQVGLLSHLCKRSDQSPNCTLQDVGDFARNPGVISKCSTTGRAQSFTQEHVDKIRSTIERLMSGDKSNFPDYCH